MGEGNIISVKELDKQIAKKTFMFPNMYPDQEFIKNHVEITKPFKAVIDYYKGTGYREINTFYKTGKIPEVRPKELLDLMVHETGVQEKDISNKFLWNYIAQKFTELYDAVQPLPHDIIVYRGIRNATVGQNLFNGDCIKSRNYKLKKHRYCKPKELVDWKYIKDYTETDNIEDYVYETLGFVSTTTGLGTALAFGCTGGMCDTVMVLRLPAGTKFIMPVEKYNDQYVDRECELILFPLHSTFVLYDHHKNNAWQIYYQNLKYSMTKKIEKLPQVQVEVGSFCDKLNDFRPITSPILRAVK